jgi:hypothetical protein
VTDAGSRTETVVLNLSDYRDNTGCALAGVDLPEGIDGFGRAFPAEELSSIAHLMGDLPVGWGHGAPDNVTCDGQRIPLPAWGKVWEIGVLGACSGGSFQDFLTLEYGPAGDSLHAAPFCLSDFLAMHPEAGEACSFEASLLRERGHDVLGPRPRLWRTSIVVPPITDCAAIRLPMNPDIHIFGLWLSATAE